MAKFIEGVRLVALQQFHDERGKVMKMLRKDDKNFDKFGEIYFSCIYPGIVKAWHKHKKMKLNYACISGAVKVVLYDDRNGSKTNGMINEFVMSPENYSLLTVPPNIWNGFKGIGNQMSTVANCSTIPHSTEEILRAKVDDESIPYNWDIKHF